jgi:hypothetical protein
MTDPDFCCWTPVPLTLILYLTLNHPYPYPHSREAGHTDVDIKGDDDSETLEEDGVYSRLVSTPLYFVNHALAFCPLSVIGVTPPKKSNKKKKKKGKGGGGTASTSNQAKTKKIPPSKATEVDDFDADFFGV